MEAAMELPVLIEPIADTGFRARIGQPIELSADGATKEEALQRLRSMFELQVANGKIVSLTVANGKPPWMNAAGIFKEDDPVIQEWVKCMQEYRDEVENDPNYP
jgi:predicted RNase H-like HicB family nuclease